MDHQSIIASLADNRAVFESILTGLDSKMYHWKPSIGKWNLLEILCHLRDEEREDFRLRCKRVLEAAEGPLPSIDPVAWVTERAYADQNYDLVLNEFLHERSESIIWLLSLKSAPWKSNYEHPKLGAMSAELFLSNWLAHDYLHMRQIIKLKFDYLEQGTGIDLSYAGKW